MNTIEFYKKLANGRKGAFEINGTLLGSKNNHKWHVCEKRGNKLRHVCGGGGPTDPRRAKVSDKIYREIFEDNSRIFTPKEFVEQDNICSNCRHLIERDFGVERLTLAVDETMDESEDIKRFVEKRREVLDKP